jgi:hypothetical protein
MAKKKSKAKNTAIPSKPPPRKRNPAEKAKAQREDDSESSEDSADEADDADADADAPKADSGLEVK